MEWQPSPQREHEWAPWVLLLRFEQVPQILNMRQICFPALERSWSAFQSMIIGRLKTVDSVAWQFEALCPDAPQHMQRDIQKEERCGAFLL